MNGIHAALPEANAGKLELLQMDGGLFSGTALTGPTIIRLVVVVVLAIVVRAIPGLALRHQSDRQTPRQKPQRR